MSTNVLEVGEVTLSDAAKRLSEIKSRDITYKDMSSLCKIFEIPTRDGSGNRRWIKAADFSRIVSLARKAAEKRPTATC